MASMCIHAATIRPECRVWRPARKLMIVQRRIGFALLAAVLGATAVQAAELPSQRHSDKPAQAEAAKKCNVAGSPGVLAGNGGCLWLNGYVTAQVGGGPPE